MSSKAKLYDLRSSTCYPASRSMIWWVYVGVNLLCVGCIFVGGVAVWHLTQKAPEGFMQAQYLVPVALFLPVGLAGLFLARVSYERQQLQFDTADALINIADNTERMATSRSQPGKDSP